METPRLWQPKPVLWRAEWVVFEDESRTGLLMESCAAVNADSLSTMTMGVAHFGQRKRVGGAGEAPLTAGEWGLGLSNEMGVPPALPGRHPKFDRYGSPSKK